MAITHMDDYNFHPWKRDQMAEYLEYTWSQAATPPSTKPPIKNTCSDKDIAIEALRTFITHSSNLELRGNIEIDDETLQKFLYARQFDIEASSILFQNYYKHRTENPEIFKNLTLESPDIQHCLENCLPGVLSSKDRKGRCVLLMNASSWDCTYSILSIYRSLWFSLEKLIEHIHNQTNGFVVIVDWTEFSFRQATYLKPSIIKLMIEGFQDCFPAKFKGIHFVGQSWCVETAFSLFMKPFLSQEIKEEFYLHGNNLSTLHEQVHKDILPSELGGEQPSYNPSSWLRTLSPHYDG